MDVRSERRDLVGELVECVGFGIRVGGGLGRGLLARAGRLGVGVSGLRLGARTGRAVRRRVLPHEIHVSPASGSRTNHRMTSKSVGHEDRADRMDHADDGMVRTDPNRHRNLTPDFSTLALRACRTTRPHDPFCGPSTDAAREKRWGDVSSPILGHSPHPRAPRLEILSRAERDFVPAARWRRRKDLGAALRPGRARSGSRDSVRRGRQPPHGRVGRAGPLRHPRPRWHVSRVGGAAARRGARLRTRPARLDARAG
jgi:hypothetical protein